MPHNGIQVPGNTVERYTANDPHKELVGKTNEEIGNTIGNGLQ